MFISKRSKFSSQFKQGAVEQVQQPGINCAQVARELCNGANLLTRWRREAEAEAPAFVVEAAGWSSAASRSFAIEGAGAESALGNRLVPRLGRPGRLGELGGGHRSPHTRLLGWHLSRTGRATTASAALEQALIARFGTLGRVPAPFLL